MKWFTILYLDGEGRKWEFEWLYSSREAAAEDMKRTEPDAEILSIRES